MDREERKLRYLEGLGYVAALMIGLGGITDVKVLKYFNILGLVFAIIVIIRLMVMNIAMGMVQKLYEPPTETESNITSADE